MKTISVKVSDSTHRSLKLICAIEHKSFSEMTRSYLEDIVARILEEHTRTDMWLEQFLSMDKDSIDRNRKDAPFSSYQI